jgi:hypothetical protein
VWPPADRPDTDLPLAGVAVSPEPLAMVSNVHGIVADIWAFSPHGAGDDESWPWRTWPRDRRMGVLPPMRSRPVHNLETIKSLIVVAAVLLDAEVRGGVFTLEQLLKKMRELLRPGQTLAADDVRAVLPDLGDCLAAVRDRWRWKHREPAYRG